MASSRVRPLLNVPSKGKVIRKTRARGLSQSTGTTFNRLTVVWVAQNGVPFNTTGFFARLFRGNQLISTAFFDRFGVVRFNNVRTLTNATFTIQVIRNDGVLFRTRTIPAGVQTFAIIG
ncbi:hypothetical protein Back11_31400 [Paenibacillus baekrokdamisoli]|uniref:Uncharacterized protein n=1 Tax=Paenibacillus baekrokdamisoli TaxID=1712516 RepID=A0A3G9J0B4_9BACL|nr:hypothetical protein [Paenibacillus baekrokdamisoli]MBB3071696.1 hypothetical protein [Paenibacillus baekrokdamisoli]BBH21795.1 hypothetical protein Back11_31400 [Paenibacillus baekrokdamisoli]